MSRCSWSSSSKGDDFTLAFAATPYEITHNEDLDEPIAIPVRVRVQDRFGSEHLEERRAARPHALCPIPVRFTLLTSMFLHGSWMHLLGNMLYLWIVGDNVEEVLGWFGYLVVYLACGLVGSLAQILVNPDSITPTLGASGAIAGIMGAYVIWFPHNQIRVLLVPVHHGAAGHRRDRRLDCASDLSGGRRVAPGRRFGRRRLSRPRRRCIDRDLRGVSFLGPGTLRQAAQLRHGRVVGLRRTPVRATPVALARPM